MFHQETPEVVELLSSSSEEGSQEQETESDAALAERLQAQFNAERVGA